MNGGFRLRGRIRRGEGTGCASYRLGATGVKKGQKIGVNKL